MRRYEIMFIVDPNLPEEEVDRVDSLVEEMVTSAGGQVESVEKMGRRKLAYEVKRHKDGFYVLFTVAADGNIVREVERRFRVMDEVLRYITVRIDLDEKRYEKVREARQRKASKRGPVPEPVESSGE